MSIRIIDFPRPIETSFYEQALQTMCKRLLALNSVVAIYQIGGVNSPGISDLDMMIVFADGVRLDQNLLEGLSRDERYLFIHNLYGVSAGNFSDVERYAFYHQYRLLAGEDVRSHSLLSDAEKGLLKIQTALEFMVKLYITLYLQQRYQVLRIRDLLLHVKAMKYDLGFLNITSGNVFQEVEQVIAWRKNWFIKPPSNEDIISWWNSFNEHFNSLLSEMLATHPFYLPPRAYYRISKNMVLAPALDKLAVVHKGFILPNLFCSIEKKYFRLQNRLNNFQFQIPMKSSEIPELLLKRFQFEQNIVEYNKRYLPHFLPVTSSLHAI